MYESWPKIEIEWNVSYSLRKEIKLKNRDPIANIHTIIIIAFLTLIGY